MCTSLRISLTELSHISFFSASEGIYMCPEESGIKTNEGMKRNINHVNIGQGLFSAN